jgi:hypothetical protein
MEKNNDELLVDFAYQNGVNLLNLTLKAFDFTRKKYTLLIIYLFAVMLLIFKHLLDKNFDFSQVEIILFLVMIYYSVIFGYVANHAMKSIPIEQPYNMPLGIINLQITKQELCQQLEESIINNTKLINRANKRIAIAINFALITPYFVSFFMDNIFCFKFDNLIEKDLNNG